MKTTILTAALFMAALASNAQTALPNYKDSTVVVNINDTLTMPPLRRQYVQVNNIPPRFQWVHNAGYCGEVSIISAGLYYGQYLSQFDARHVASPDGNQLQAYQLLLGGNDGYAAGALRLKYDRLQTNDSRSFMAWVKHHVAQGHPVIIGVFNNEYILGEDTINVLAGDSEYDHIVPVMGFASNQPLYMGYDSTDLILFSDNGIYTPAVAYQICKPAISDSVPYYFAYEMRKFFSDRREANKKVNGQVYSLLELPKYRSDLPGKAHLKQNYGIAITGVMGEEETLPVRVSTDFNYEAPCMKPKSNKRPDSMALTLTITVSGLEPNKNYNLYYYKDEQQVPSENFNQHSKKEDLWKKISISSGTTYTATLKITSNQKAFFRAVRAE